MRISTDRSEAGFKGLVELAAGDMSLVMEALEPRDGEGPVTYEDAVNYIVKTRIRRKNLTVVAPPKR
ncbi:hypothetical protein [Paraburkholderia heleia]|uniref:hypothetical protein n=1 Tax=Paraburkholderia heleia TaxID=634127 RepID=UPI002AB73BEC|nr:hypothetical protein [Paraburkholderia heleia]